MLTIGECLHKDTFMVIVVSSPYEEWLWQHVNIVVLRNR
jgi:hypothetical protein